MPLMKRQNGVRSGFVHWGPTQYTADEDGCVQVKKEHVATAIAAGFVEVLEPQPAPKVRETLHLKK